MRLFFLIILYFSIFGIYGQPLQINPSNWPNLKGLWNFDNPNNLTSATFGSDLVLTGFQSPIAGPSAGDLAVSIGVGSNYKCFHNIPANSGGAMVNEYSLVIDFRAPSINPWYCFYQAHTTNSNDGELFINPTGKIGRATNGPGYSEYTVIPGEWYRLVVTCDLGYQYNYYLDGVLIRQGGALALNGDFALSPSSASNYFYFFADNDGEDAAIDIALCAVFQGSLTNTQVSTLGGFGHEIPSLLTGILPYLQTATPTSIIINWHSDSLTSTQVQYGTSPILGSTTSGNFESIGIKKWHTVTLTGLLPNTEYFYRCINGSVNSEIYAFRTPPLVEDSASHVRFLIFGDNQSNPSVVRTIANKAKLKCQELYGYDLQNHINLILHLGDIVGDGSVNTAYEDEYFKPFSSLSALIPSMVTIGNHEGDNAFYYQYMKYEDLNGALSPYQERYYTFNILNSRFIAINPNTIYQNAAQQNWFQSKLIQVQSDPGTDFCFVYGHQPAYSEIWPDGNTAWVQSFVFNQMKSCSKSGIYACGHTHAYEHSVVESTSDSSGFHCILNGGGGGSLDRWGMFTNQTDYQGTFRSHDYYCFTLIDVDVVNNSFTGFTYSLGNPDHPLNCELIDVFHKKADLVKPTQPLAIFPQGATIPPIILQSSDFSGSDSLFSSQFQVTLTPGNFQSPILDIKRDKENWYGDSGAPGYFPSNQNDSIDLQSLIVQLPFNYGQNYSWRARYRDYNLKWSDWSGERVFMPVTGYNISGTITYANGNSTPISQVSVSLYRNDTLIALTQSSLNGSFTFNSLLPGSYNIRCNYNGIWGGVNALDALLILKHFVGTAPLTGILKLAGDADLSTHINSVDALFAAKRFAGLITSYPAGDWIMNQPVITLNGNQTIEIKAVCTTDVNGSFLP
jgi:hypothetical protein